MLAALWQSDLGAAPTAGDCDSLLEPTQLSDYKFVQNGYDYTPVSLCQTDGHCWRSRLLGGECGKT